MNLDNFRDEDGNLPSITPEGREYMNLLLDRNFNSLTWVANETQKLSATGSLQHPLPGSAEALMVAIWGPDGVTTCGAQMQRRCADGKVEFDELKWEKPSTEFRFARGNMGQTNNVLGVPAASKKGCIN